MFLKLFGVFALIVLAVDAQVTPHEVSCVVVPGSSSAGSNYKVTCTGHVDIGSMDNSVQVPISGWLSTLSPYGSKVRIDADPINWSFGSVNPVLRPVSARRCREITASYQASCACNGSPVSSDAINVATATSYFGFCNIPAPSARGCSSGQGSIQVSFQGGYVGPLTNVVMPSKDFQEICINNMCQTGNSIIENNGERKLELDMHAGKDLTSGFNFASISGPSLPGTNLPPNSVMRIPSSIALGEFGQFCAISSPFESQTNEMASTESVCHNASFDSSVDCSNELTTQGDDADVTVPPVVAQSPLNSPLAQPAPWASITNNGGLKLTQYQSGVVKGKITVSTTVQTVEFVRAYNLQYEENADGSATVSFNVRASGRTILNVAGAVFDREVTPGVNSFTVDRTDKTNRACANKGENTVCVDLITKPAVVPEQKTDVVTQVVVMHNSPATFQSVMTLILSYYIVLVVIGSIGWLIVRIYHVKTDAQIRYNYQIIFYWPFLFITVGGLWLAGWIAAKFKCGKSESIATSKAALNSLAKYRQISTIPQ